MGVGALGAYGREWQPIDRTLCSEKSACMLLLVLATVWTRYECG